MKSKKVENPYTLYERKKINKVIRVSINEMIKRNAIKMPPKDIKAGYARADLILNDKIEEENLHLIEKLYKEDPYEMKKQ
jgi:hypothetical protein